MKHIRRWLLMMILVMAMSVPMTSASFGAVKDYATLSWVTDLINYESSQPSGSIRITITGVVGTQTGNGTVDIAELPA